MGTAPANVLVVVVNYKTAALTGDCLSSLEPEAAAMPGMRVVVADNGSGDGSVERLRSLIERRGWSGWVDVLALEKNGGFAAGNNAALSWAMGRGERPEYVFLLNPDTLVRARAVQELVGFMEARPEVGIAGSVSEDPDGSPQYCSFRFPSVLSELESSVSVGVLSRLLRRWQVRLPHAERSRPVDWVSGAALMVRRSVIEKVGLLDERFFMYFEEVDYCRRAKHAGFEVWHVPSSRIVHLVGRSSGVTRQEERPRRRPAYWYDAQRLYWLKNHGPLVTAAADVVRIVGAMLYRVHTGLRGRATSLPRLYVVDLCRNSVLVRGDRELRAGGEPGERGMARAQAGCAAS